jgi:hypothetical protein
LASVRKIEALKAELVVPGQKRTGELDGAFPLKETRKYIETFERLLLAPKSVRELSQGMLEEYPTRFNADAF